MFDVIYFREILKLFFIHGVLLATLAGYSQQTISTSKLLDSLFMAHDSFNVDLTKKLLSEINEDDIPYLTKQDSIIKNIYSTIKYFTLTIDELYYSEENINGYIESIEYIRDHIGIEYCPAYIVNLARKIKNKKEYHEKTLSLLDQSIEASNKKLNKSRNFSEYNHLKSLELRIEILVKKYEENPAEKQKNTILQLAKDALIFYDENIDIFIKHSSDRFLINGLLNVIIKYEQNNLIDLFNAHSRRIQCMIKYGKDDWYYGEKDRWKESVSNYFSQMRYTSKDYNDYSTLLFLNNKYVNEIDEITFLCNKIYSKNEYDLNDLERILNLIEIQFNKNDFSIDVSIFNHISYNYAITSRQNVKNEKEKELIYKLLKLTVFYFEHEDNPQLLVSSIDLLIGFLESYGDRQDLLVGLRKEKYNIVKNIFDTGTSEDIFNIGYGNVIDFIIMNYAEIQLNDQGKALIESSDYFDKYLVLIKNDYQKMLDYVYFFYLKVIAQTRSQNNLETFISFKEKVIPLLKNNISFIDLRLRIELASSNEEYANLQNFIDENPRYIGKSETSEDLYLSILIKLYDLKPQKEIGSDIYNYYLDNKDEFFSKKTYFNTIVYLIIRENIKSRLNEFSNDVLQFYTSNKYSLKQDDLYLIQKSLGNFYKYIGNESMAIYFYYDQLSNSSLRRTQLEFTNIFQIYYELFYLNLSLNRLNDCEIIMNDFERVWENDFRGLTIDWAIYKDLYNDLNRKKLLMKRSYFDIKKDYENEKRIIHKMIDSNLFDSFTLEMMLLSNSLHLKELIPEKYAIKLERLYEKYSIPKDDYFYSLIVGMSGNNLQNFNDQLEKFSNKMEQMSFYNEMSFENQLALYKSQYKNKIILIDLFTRLEKNEQFEKSKPFLDFFVKDDNLDIRNQMMYKNSDNQVIDSLLGLRKEFLNAIDYNDYENYLKLRVEIDLLQQKVKMSNKSISFNLENITNALNKNQAYIRIISKYNGEFYDYFCFILKKE